MKAKIFKVIVLVVISTTQIKSQTRTAWQYGAWPNSHRISSVIKQNIVPGWLWWGYIPNATSGWWQNKNFHMSGHIPAGLNTCQAFEIMHGGPGCTGPLVNSNNCAGVSALETNLLSGTVRYAVAGAFSEGVFYMTTNSAGIANNSDFYPWPFPPTLPVTKPHICEEVNTNNFFITGTIDQFLYCLKIDQFGNLMWSYLYNLGSSFVPNGIVQNIYSPHEIIIVGSTMNPPAGSCPGQPNVPFFMKLDANVGSVIMCKLYSTFGCANDGVFNAIIPSASNGGPEFLIGGGIKTPGAPESWLLKVDQNGTVLWSQLLVNAAGSSGNFSGALVSLVERQNSNALYEIYTLCQTTGGSTVFKLDAMGNPNVISTPSQLFNEFTYDLPSANPAVPLAITYNNSAMSVGHDVGISVFSNEDNSASNPYAQWAYFNGQVPCYGTYAVMNPNQNHPVQDQMIGVPNFAGFSQCTNFNIVNSGGMSSINYPCSGSMLSGDNSRTSGQFTSVDMVGESETVFDVFPNPTSGKTTILLPFSTSQANFAQLTNLIGQKIAEIPVKSGIENLVNLEELNIPEGVYFLSVQIEGTQQQKKIVYQK